MLSEVLFAFWFFIPAGIANMAPVIVAQIPVLRKMNAPMDFGATLKGKPLLGPHKTWRGLGAGIIAATLTFWAQQSLVRHLGWFAQQASDHRYLTLSIGIAGLAFAVGALGGDAVKSFIKRRKGIASGGVWLPYDLVDHIVGAAIIVAPLVMFDWWVYAIVFCVWAFANLGISYVAYLLKVKERPI